MSALRVSPSIKENDLRKIFAQDMHSSFNETSDSPRAVPFSSSYIEEASSRSFDFETRTPMSTTMQNKGFYERMLNQPVRFSWSKVTDLSVEGLLSTLSPENAMFFDDISDSEVSSFSEDVPFDFFPCSRPSSTSSSPSRNDSRAHFSPPFVRRKARDGESSKQPFRFLRSVNLPECGTVLRKPEDSSASNEERTNGFNTGDCDPNHRCVERGRSKDDDRSGRVFLEEIEEREELETRHGGSSINRDGGCGSRCPSRGPSIGGGETFSRSGEGDFSTQECIHGYSFSLPLHDCIFDGKKLESLKNAIFGNGTTSTTSDGCSFMQYPSSFARYDETKFYALINNEDEIRALLSGLMQKDSQAMMIGKNTKYHDVVIDGAIRILSDPRSFSFFPVKPSSDCSFGETAFESLTKFIAEKYVSVYYRYPLKRYYSGLFFSKLATFLVPYREAYDEDDSDYEGDPLVKKKGEENDESEAYFEKRNRESRGQDDSKKVLFWDDFEPPCVNGLSKGRHEVDEKPSWFQLLCASETDVNPDLSSKIERRKRVAKTMDLSDECYIEAAFDCAQFASDHPETAAGLENCPFFMCGHDGEIPCLDDVTSSAEIFMRFKRNLKDCPKRYVSNPAKKTLIAATNLRMIQKILSGSSFGSKFLHSNLKDAVSGYKDVKTPGRIRRRPSRSEPPQQTSPEKEVSSVPRSRASPKQPKKEQRRPSRPPSSRYRNVVLEYPSTLNDTLESAFNMSLVVAPFHDVYSHYKKDLSSHLLSSRSGVDARYPGYRNAHLGGLSLYFKSSSTSNLKKIRTLFEDIHLHLLLLDWHVERYESSGPKGPRMPGSKMSQKEMLEYMTTVCAKSVETIEEREDERDSPVKKRSSECLGEDETEDSRVNGERFFVKDEQCKTERIAPRKGRKETRKKGGKKRRLGMTADSRDLMIDLTFSTLEYLHHMNLFMKGLFPRFTALDRSKWVPITRECEFFKSWLSFSGMTEECEGMVLSLKLSRDNF